jgi:hypothetical protein
MNLEHTLNRLRDLSTPGAVPGRCLNCVAVMRLTLDVIAKNPKTDMPEFTAEQVEAEVAVHRCSYCLFAVYGVG